MITPLFTSCPTFLCAQLPSSYSYWGKEGIILPRMHRDMASVWPRPPWCQTLAAGGVTFRSLLSNENRLLWLSGCCGIGSCCRANRFDINDTKIRDRTGQSLNLQQRPTFRYLPYCGGQIALRYSPRLCQVHFFAQRLCFTTTFGGSKCLQVIGSAGRWSQVRNELTPDYTKKHLDGLRTHAAAPLPRMFAHYPTPPVASPLSACHLTLDCFTMALWKTLGEVKGARLDTWYWL